MDSIFKYRKLLVYLIALGWIVTASAEGLAAPSTGQTTGGKPAAKHFKYEPAPPLEHSVYRFIKPDRPYRSLGLTKMALTSKLDLGVDRLVGQLTSELVSGKGGGDKLVTELRRRLGAGSGKATVGDVKSALSSLLAETTQNGRLDMNALGKRFGIRAQNLVVDVENRGFVAAYYNRVSRKRSDVSLSQVMQQARDMKLIERETPVVTPSTDKSATTETRPLSTIASGKTFELVPTAGAKHYGQDRMLTRDHRFRSIGLIKYAFSGGSFTTGAEGYARDLQRDLIAGDGKTDPLIGEIQRRTGGGSPTVEQVRMALKSILVESAQGGKLDTVAFGQRFGKRGLVLASALENQGLVNASFSRKFRIEGGINLDEMLSASKSVGVSQMDVLAALSWHQKKTKPLAGYRVAGMQHLVGDTEQLVVALTEAGVKANQISLVGKIYSQNATVAKNLEKRGVHVAPLLKPTDAGGVTSEEMAAHAATFLKGEMEQLKKNPGQKLLLIDDGGQMIRLVQEKWPELAGRVVAVEQTTRGLIELKGMKLKFPVISVAGSDAKRKYESPSIGRAVGANLHAYLNDLAHQGVAIKKRVLLVGYGAVGEHTGEYLKSQGYEVAIFDKSPAVRVEARKAGLLVYDSLESALPNAGVVLSATGREGINLKQMELLPDNAILASGGSLTHEIDRTVLTKFGSPDFRRPTAKGGTFVDFFGGKQIQLEGPSEFQINRVAKLPSGKRLMVLVGGYPINFRFDARNGGGTSVLPPSHAQLTVGLLFAGALEAAQAHDAGIQSLSTSIQDALVKGVNEQLSRTGETLEHPTFDYAGTPAERMRLMGRGFATHYQGFDEK